VTRVRVFLRGFALVTITAANVSQIAAQHYWGAFVCGFLISWLWWKNANTAAHVSVRYSREAYAAGAGCGTVAGIWLVRAIYG
jgi:hypothetical protein